ncbi:hypothetical protein ACHAXR_008115, partial [Thalassiosira sp. AJA248-18]
PTMATPAYNRTETGLESRARSLLASSIRTIGNGPNKFIYPIICDGVDGVVDSTTTLITARALSKLGRSDLAWEFLRTLFAAQGSDGFLPRFVYLEENTGEEEGGSMWNKEFIGPYPGPKLFNEVDAFENGCVPLPDAHYRPGKKSQSRTPKKCDSNLTIRSSNTLMAQPHHATTILEIFYLSDQTMEDLNNLDFFYQLLLPWHTFLHKQIITSCSGSDKANVPCLTVRHPWETEIDMSSLIWVNALQNVTKIVSNEGWRPNYEIPAAVKSTFDYPGDSAYNSLLYLLQCLSDHAEDDSDINNGHSTTHELFNSACPFQMVDVGFIAALSKADHDLLQIGEILDSWDGMELARERSHTSKRMLHNLWDDGKGSFFNQAINLALNANGTYSSNTTSQLKLPVGSNFLAFWDLQSNSTIVESMSSHLLERSGQFSFYCGDYPLVTVGGCAESFGSEIPDSSSILFLLNYRVSKGLSYNKQIGLGKFLQSSSLNLICGLPNSYESNLTDCLDNQQFAIAYNATSHQPLSKDVCGLTSTLAAAIVLEMMIPDKAFKYDSPPPISSSSVVFLIAGEMVVAFGVGIVCLLLSLNLMRRAKADEEGDAFVQIIREQQEEELLVQSPIEVTEEVGGSYHGEMNNAGLGTWSLELISRFWGKGQTHTE